MNTSARILQLGTVVFAGLAVLSAAVCLVRGVTPLYALQALLWTGLAVLWHLKQITNRTANYAMLALASAVLLINAFSVGRVEGFRAGFAAGERMPSNEGSSMRAADQRDFVTAGAPSCQASQRFSNGWPERRTLLQLGVLCFRRDGDGNIGVGFFPKREEILIGRPRLSGVTLQGVGTGEAEMGECTQWEI